MTQFLIDSGALLAMVDRADQHHQSAAAFARSHRNDQFLLPETVFVETMVLSKARLGSRAAVELGNRLAQSSQFSILVPTDTDRQLIWFIFSQYLDKDWSYVDCSLLAAARRLQIVAIFSFDRHFDQMPEVQRVPELL
jgi:predicted nucleic acid-binding protein